MTAIPVQTTFGFGAPRRRNIVIEAGAGTGKTTAIVAEVLKLLLGETAVDPERIILVTFTEKAAGEIAERIHQALIDIDRTFAGNADAAIEWPIGSPSPLVTIASSRRDVCAAQLARADALRSQTIHSFCQSLLRQFPIEAGLDPQFTIVEGFERALLYGELYDAWVDAETRVAPTAEVRRDWETVIEHCNYLFLIRDLVFGLVDRRDLLAEEADIGALDLVEHELLIAIERLRGCEVESVGAICDYLRAHPSPRRGSDLETWMAYLRPIANDIRNTDLPRGKKSEFNDAIRVLRADEKQKGTSVYDRLTSHRAAVALLSMTRRFVRFLDDEKRKRGVVDFDDLLIRTLAVLEDDAVAARARAAFDVLFVDEFQDTDRIQARVFERLARDEHGALVPGRIVVVGDPKQSIYGFRRADPETYNAFTQTLIAAGADPRLLRDQFRSDPVLLDAINLLFGELFADAAHDPNVFRPAYHPLTAARPRSSSAGAPLTVIDVACEERDGRYLAEAEAIASWIAERGGELRRYAILFRRMTKLDDYLDVFERRGIDYVLPPTRLFLDRPAPVDLLAVLRAIAWPFDRGAEISAARSPYFALTDDEIARGLLSGDPTWDAFRATLDGFRAASRRLTVAQLIDRIVDACHIEAVYAAAADGKRSLRHLEHLRAIAFAYDQRTGGSVAAFVDEIARRRGEPDESEPSLLEEGSDAVRIMTVHGAKGLEFDCVIVPDLEFPPKPPDVFLIDEPKTLVVRGQVETLSSHYGRAGDRPLKEIASQREDAETRRLFYVAVTRAKEEVVFVANAKPSRSGFAKYMEMVAALPEGYVARVPAGEAAGGSPSWSTTRRKLADAALESSLAASPIVPAEIPPPPPIAAPLPRAEVLIRRASARKRGAGILLHRVLELWDGRAPVEPLLNAAATELGADAATLSLVRQRLASVVRSPTFVRIAAAETIGRELPLITPAGERRIDRLVRENGSTLVIDYKSGAPTDERIARDRAQVAAYCAALAAIDATPVRGLLWYIDVDADRAIEV